MTDVIVWTKPDCVQCRMVKGRLDAAQVPYVERDLTAPESADDLSYFKGLGYFSAPVTEYGGIAFPGFNPGEVQRVIDAWKSDQGVPVAEQGRRLASQREDLIVRGANPSDLLVPLFPDVTDGSR